MAYQTGSATDIINLVGILSTFLSTNGFTINREQGTLITTKELLFNDANEYYVLRTTDDAPWYDVWTGGEGNHGLLISLATGYSSGDDRNSQPGMMSNTSDTGYAGYAVLNYCGGSIPEYHFFYSGGELNIVFLTSKGLWRHFGLGMITKMGTFTGGGYVYTNALAINYALDSFSQIANNYKSFFDYYALTGTNNLLTAMIRAEIDMTDQFFTNVNPSLDGSNTLNVGHRCEGDGGLTITSTNVADPTHAFRQQWSMNSYSTSAILQVIECYLYDRISTDKKLLYGYLSTVKRCNMYFQDPGDVMSLASGDWVLFPVSRKLFDKAPDDNIPATWTYGFAFKKVT